MKVYDDSVATINVKAMPQKEITVLHGMDLLNMLRM
jgi:hypothetical protein